MYGVNQMGKLLKKFSHWGCTHGYIDGVNEIWLLGYKTSY